MASVNFSEKEYMAVASAAMDAYRHGDMQQAKALNELASKMNKTLSVVGHSALISFGPRRGQRDWRAPGPIDKELGLSSTDTGESVK